MRRGLNWLVLAVTGLLVVAFVVPLGLLVRRQAEERAQVAAEQRAQATAAALAVAVAAAGGDVNRAVAESAVVSDVSLVLPDGTEVGLEGIPPSLVSTVRAGQAAAELGDDGAWRVGLPVATPAGVVVVAAVADPDQMTAGVPRATVLLGGLALALVAGSMVLADRMGRSLVSPVRRVAEVAHRLADGDLTARAGEQGPPEIQEVSRALNSLASRLETIIEGERQALADLSHCLRTPLTALRLEAERLQPGDSLQGLLRQVDRTQEAVHALIREVRDRGRSGQLATDVVDVVRSRLAFWSVLAADQDRRVEERLTDGALTVAVGDSELAAAIDALIGNVFDHTPPGSAFSVAVEADGATPVVIVSDSGPGFADPDAALGRGASPGGSTGLGLNIAASLCRRLGGSLVIDEGPDGGALVMMRLGG